MKSKANRQETPSFLKAHSADEWETAGQEPRRSARRRGSGPPAGRGVRAGPGRPGGGFTLVEVVIASAIFCMAMLAILGMLATGIHAATLLRKNGPTPGWVAGMMTMSNKLEEGFDSGNFGADMFPDYYWQREVRLYSTNGLFQVDIVVFHNGNPDSSLSLLLYRPGSGAPGMSR